MYEGYLTASGVEIINAERTETYVANVGDGVGLRPQFNTDKIHLAAEDDAYRSPLIDDAPWVNPLDLTSTDFLGLYPLEIQGLDESTMSATVTEHLDDGASFGIQRDTSRAVRVHGVLVGATHAGAEYGLSWLADAVRASECSMLTSCSAGDLVYYVAPPDVCEGAFGDEQINPDSKNFGSLAEPRLVSYRWPTDTTPVLMPSRVSWSGSWRESTRFTYGVLSRSSQDFLSESGVIAPIRRNYVINPGMTRGTDQWGAYGANISWQPGPGYAGDGYATAVPAQSGFGAATFGTSPFGVGAGAGQVVDPAQFGTSAFGASAFGGGYTGATGSLVVQPTTGVVPGGEVTVAIAVRTSVDVVDALPVNLSVSDASGSLLGWQSGEATADWGRISVTVQLASDQALTIQISSSATFDYDAASAEVGAGDQPYFDGSVLLPGYDVHWLGEPGETVSEAIWTGGTEIIRPDSDWRPFFRLTDGSVDNLTLTWFRRDEISIEEQLLPYQRTLHDVTCTQGPQVIARYSTSVGYFIEIDLILVAGNPHPYGNPVSVTTSPLTSAPYSDPDTTPVLDDSWLADPDSVAVTAPTRAPVILDTSVQVFSDWQRYYVSIPAATVREWGQSVPTLGINSHDQAITQIRVRFHPNPFDYDALDVDPLNYCSEFVVSYLPNQARLLVDGITQSAVASKAGYATVPADHLLFGGADGSPITWPELSCGISYLMTLDVPTASQIDLFDVDLVMRARG